MEVVAKAREGQGGNVGERERTSHTMKEMYLWLTLGREGRCREACVILSL